MKDKLLALAFEYLLTKETAKKLARKLNKKLQEISALGDGKISDAELEKINAQTDALIDKYID